MIPQDLRILLVEDEKKIAEILRAGLTENNFFVDVAYDGLVAQKVFDAHRFDLVILDINIPGLSGYDLCKHIRLRNQRIPIIMLTALNSTEDKVVGFEAGADDYIIKPFDFKELLVRIKALLKRIYQFQAGSNVLKISDLSIDFDSKEVTRSGKNISLTAKEFQLLEYLARNKNKVVSRADIALNVWDIDFDSKTNVIEVYVNFLRKKIDKDFPSKLIHTHIGMGYVLKEQPA